TLGAICGSLVADHGSRALGFVGLLAVATAGLLLAAALALAVLRHARGSPEAERPLLGKPLQGWRDVARGRYLRGIAVYLLLFTIATTFVYFERRDLVQTAITDRAERTSYHARVDAWSNGLTLAGQ